jgi:hypothetical protein
MDVSENHALQRNMAKIKHSHEEIVVAKFENMEKKRNLLKEQKKKMGSKKERVERGEEKMENRKERFDRGEE